MKYDRINIELSIFNRITITTLYMNKTIIVKAKTKISSKVHIVTPNSSYWGNT